MDKYGPVVNLTVTMLIKNKNIEQYLNNAAAAIKSEVDDGKVDDNVGQLKTKTENWDQEVLVNIRKKIKRMFCK